MDIEERVDKLEVRIGKLEDAIPEIQSGIREIKAILQERPIQEDLKNSILEEKFRNLEKRVEKLEDTQKWLWRTVAGSIITIIVGTITFVVKMM